MSFWWLCWNWDLAFLIWWLFLTKTVNSWTFQSNWLYVIIMSRKHFRVNPQSIFAWMSRNSFVSLAKWLSVHLRTKWLWVRVPLQSLKFPEQGDLRYFWFIATLTKRYNRTFSKLNWEKIARRHYENPSQKYWNCKVFFCLKLVTIAQLNSLFVLYFWSS